MTDCRPQVCRRVSGVVFWPLLMTLQGRRCHRHHPCWQICKLRHRVQKKNLQKDFHSSVLGIHLLELHSAPALFSYEPALIHAARDGMKLQASRLFQVRERRPGDSPPLDSESLLVFS